MSPQAHIEVTNVTKRFRLDNREIEAISEVSFAIQEGEFVALIGPSGCGKSTLLKMIADILPPSDGTILVAGSTPAQARKQRLFGVVFQDPVLLPWRSVLDNIRLPLEVAKEDSSSEQVTEDLIDLVGLRGFERALPWQLSGGMKQRVAIARSLVLSPSVLLLDEPFGALDEITRQRLNVDLLRIWSQHLSTALLVTHSLAEAIFLADRVLVMTPRPARISKVVEVTLPRPRQLSMLRSHECHDLINEVTEALYAPFEALIESPDGEEVSTRGSSR